MPLRISKSFAIQTARDRVQLAPQYHYEDAQKLYCRPCNEEIAFKKVNVIYSHLKSGRHSKKIDLQRKYGVQNPPDAPPKPRKIRVEGKEAGETTKEAYV